MARVIHFAAFFATVFTFAATEQAATATGPHRCDSEIDDETSSMLQKPMKTKHKEIPISFVQTGAVRAEEHSETTASSAGDVLASVHHLVDVAKGWGDAGKVALERKLTPKIQAAVVAFAKLSASQRAAAKKCDRKLQAELTSKGFFQRAFHKKRTNHEACLVGKGRMSQLELGWRSDAAEYAAKAAECVAMRTEVDSAACALASHAHGVCGNYGGCRARSMAVYKSAPDFSKATADDHHAQLLEAQQAQCIASGLVESDGHLETLLEHLGRCEALTVDELNLDAQGHTLATMHSAVSCQDALVRPCVDGFLELDVSANETWSASCEACSAMVARQEVETSAKTSAETAAESSVEASTETSTNTSAVAFAEASIEASAEAFAETSADAVVSLRTRGYPAEAFAETSAVASAEASIEASAEAFAETSAEAFVSLRTRAMSWLPGAKEFKDRAWMVLSPRRRAAKTVDLIELGAASMGNVGAIDSKTTTRTSGEYIVPLLVLVVAVLGVVCLIAEAFPGVAHTSSHNSRERVSGQPGTKSAAANFSRERSGGENPMDAQKFSTPKLPMHSARSAVGSVHERPSMGSSPYTQPGSVRQSVAQTEHYDMSRAGSIVGGMRPSVGPEHFDMSRGGSLVPSMRPSIMPGAAHGQPEHYNMSRGGSMMPGMRPNQGAEHYSMSRGGSLMPSMRPSLVMTPRGSIPFGGESVVGGLCPELNVPPGNECIVGMPSLAGSVPGEVLLKDITDKSGQPLLYAGVTSAPAGGEYVFLAKQSRGGADPQGRQELAFCETGSAVRAKGWVGKIFSWDGELFAQLREASGTSPGNSILPGQASAGPSYVIVSASGPSWELRVMGSFKDRRLTVEDGNRQTVAMVSPGEDLGRGAMGGAYRLRLGPGANSCTVMLALMAIERGFGQAPIV